MCVKMGTWLSVLRLKEIREHSSNSIHPHSQTTWLSHFTLQWNKRSFIETLLNGLFIFHIKWFFFTLLTTELRPEKHTGHWCTAWVLVRGPCFPPCGTGIAYVYIFLPLVRSEKLSQPKREVMCVPTVQCSAAASLWWLDNVYVVGLSVLLWAPAKALARSPDLSVIQRQEWRGGPSLTAPTLQTWASMIQNPNCLSFSAFLWLSCIRSRL